MRGQEEKRQNVYLYLLNYIEEWVVEETQEPVHIMLCDEEITDEYFEKFTK